MTNSELLSALGLLFAMSSTAIGGMWAVYNKFVDLKVQVAVNSSKWEIIEKMEASIEKIEESIADIKEKIARK